MIRTPPQHNTINPPGQIVNPIHQDRTLVKEIDAFQKDEIYMKGYRDGFRMGLQSKFPDIDSETLR